jgi:MFS family permease
MDTQDAAFEAEVELDIAAQQEERLRRERGQIAAQVAKGGIDISSSRAGQDDGAAVRGDADESSPLLPRDGQDGRKPSGTAAEWESDFAHLPWYRRPSIFWVLGPFFLMTLAYGGSLTPKVNLILELICQEYISERMIQEPGFTMAPVDFFNGADNDQCRIPEVQSRVSIFMLYGSLMAGLLAAFTSPKLGALSDRYGRKFILVFTSTGTICAEIITIFAALYPDTFPVSLLLVGFALDGLTGSFIVAMAIANSYATDCTPPAMRNVAFGYFHGCLFTGLALGPVLAGYLVKATGKIVIVFYILLAVHTTFALFIGLFVPESLSKRRQMMAREKYEKDVAELGPTADWVQSLRSLNLFAPLNVLWPTGPGSSPALRRNLFVLAAVDTILFGVAMGSITVVVIYTNYQFGWKTWESSRFMSIVNSCRVFCLVVVLPIITRIARGRTDPDKKNEGADMFDLTVIRVAVLFDTLGYLGYTLARQGGPFILAGALASIGGIGSPTMQSALTKHVPAEQTGQLLGASGLLHALARVVAPTVFNAIYSATVGKYTQTVFVCLTATFGLAFVISWFIRPGGKLDRPYS